MFELFRTVTANSSLPVFVYHNLFDNSYRQISLSTPERLSAPHRARSGAGTRWSTVLPLLGDTPRASSTIRAGPYVSNDLKPETETWQGLLHAGIWGYWWDNP